MSAPVVDWLFFAAAVAAIAAAAILWRGRRVTTVYSPDVGLLYRDGRFERELAAGRYSWLDPLRRRTVVPVPLTELPVQYGEITVLSKDQFSFRIGLAPVLKIVDARLYIESQGAVGEHARAHFLPAPYGHPALHASVAAAALEAVGSFTLAEALADQRAVADAILARLVAAIPGAEVLRVLLTSVNLPPETRKMFTEVERARIDGQAALERARGEQAALRVLANAARLVNDNPGLANLRLLQAIEASKGSATIVIGHPAAPLPGLGADGRALSPPD